MIQGKKRTTEVKAHKSRSDFELGNGFLEKKKSNERKTDWTSSKFKTVGASKDTNQEREKTTHVMGENICKAYMWEENII